jgi:hypothetical protein
MVMSLFRGMRCPDLLYSVVYVREAKYIRLGYKIRLSMLHALDPPCSITFSEEQPFDNTGPRARK